MSSYNIAIRVSHLGKKYAIGGLQEQYHTLRDAIVNSLKAPFKILHRTPPEDGFWALKGVSFQIESGEIVGIIGHNGAGKSTLLKILSRITTPTEGCVELHGRVGSLLEVGTGFHSELTGRENIFLSGSILGMKRHEVERKFDDIVKFSEIEQFIDTPVKRYSSGMYVRLAFAVAAHLEPEILLVDEVLAVGDASFQKKCLGKMGEVGREGRTVIFVSHNLTAVKALCNRCIVISAGQIQFDGDTNEAIDYYLGYKNSPDEEIIPIAERTRERYCNLRAKIMEITVISDEQRNPKMINPFKPLIVQLTVEAKSDVRCSATLYISDEIQNICMFDTQLIDGRDVSLKPGMNIIECYMSPLNLYAGDYLIKCELNIHGQEHIDRVHDAYSFSIDSCDPKGSGYNIVKGYHGIFYINHDWK
ncbi:MAG: ABC transporter ATP-binding protein [Methanomicrobiales archaeon HGW-Methanomicrobiales-1]|jgi:lipopolysaccharide transport system ATP-binding protein|nr:MAG: ABC transporter ATP-binding protein [Methanomicrobiales archaeon HGW-Methanomicrobiales-1]